MSDKRERERRTSNRSPSKTSSTQRNRQNTRRRSDSKRIDISDEDRRRKARENQNKARKNSFKTKKKKENKEEAVRLEHGMEPIGQRKTKKRTGNKKKLRKSVKRRKQAAFLFKMLLVIMIVTVSFLTTTMFFKIETIEVLGDTRYDKDEIMSLLYIEPGDNLLFVEKISMKNRILNTYPYLSSVDIDRDFPDRLVVTVEETVAVYNIITSHGNFLANEDGKILEQNTDMSLVIIHGFDLSEMEIGDNFLSDGSVQALNFKTIMESLEKYNMLDSFSMLNFTYNTAISGTCNGIYTVNFGDTSDIDKKIRLLETILEQLGDEGLAGVIDVSDASTGRFIPSLD